MGDGYLTSAPSTPKPPLTPLPLLVNSRPADRTGAQVKPSLLSKCFSVDKLCGGDHETSLNVDPFPDACAYPPVPSVSLTRKVGAEFIGTFILIFAGTASAIVNEKTGGSVTTVGMAAAPGLAVMVVILATGHISGAHLNPSLTIAFAALRHLPWIQVPAYLTAQIIGSISASFALKLIYHPDLQGGVTVPTGSVQQSLALEFIISFNLMFVVTAVATDTRAVGELAGIAVGATVMMNILIAGATSGGSMNPVRTLGPAIAANNYRGLWVYVLGPIVGALAGAAAYTLVRQDGEEGPGGRPVRSFRR